MVYSASTAAPAPRMLPVWGKLPPPGLGIGTALALNCEILAVISAGATVAKPRAPRAIRPSTARQVDALRIRFSPLLMDIRLDPGSSGAIAGPAISRSPAQRRRTLASLLADNISVARGRRKLEAARREPTCSRAAQLYACSI